MPNYQQPDFRVPTPATLPTCSNAINADPIGVSIAPVNYIEPGLNDRDDPHRAFRGPNRTKLGF